MDDVGIQAAVAGVLLALGAVLKRAVPSETLHNKWIPLVLLTIGTPLYSALVNDWSITSLVAGFLCAASAIGIHQTAQQTTGKSL